ncbi:MAG: NAD(P)H-binding protein, partial [Solirubrobacterales bacterium]
MGPREPALEPSLILGAYLAHAPGLRIASSLGGMKIFLTGATGFIGGHIARKLRDRGDDVRVLVRSLEKGRELAGIGCDLVVGDLGDT